MNFSPKKKEVPEINLTPLIDVVLQLVIFFMVTTQFITMPGIAINLPTVSPSSKATAMERIELTISATGTLYINEKLVPNDAFSDALARSGHDPHDTAVLISADRATSHGRIVDIMDKLRQQGFQKIVFAAQNETEAQNHELISP